MNPENQTNAEPKVPTKEEVIAFLKEQIEVKTLQAQLQSLNTALATDKASEMEAFAKIKHFSPGPADDNIVEHVVSVKDMELNPDFAAQGIKAGDKIGIPKEAFDTLKLGEDKPKATGSPLSIVN